MRTVLNSVYFNIGNFIYIGAQWIISVVLVRMGGFEDAGYFSLAMTYGNIFCVFANYGLRTYQVSDIDSKFNDSTYVVLRIITVSASVFICYGFSVMFMGYGRRLNLLILYYIFYKISESYADVLTGIWQKHGNILSIGVSYTVKGVLSLVSFLLVYYFKRSLLSATLVMTAVHFAVLVLFDFNITEKYVSQIKLYKNINKKEIVDLLGIGFSTMLFTLLTVLFNSIPRLIIEKKVSAEMLGVFSSLYNPTVIISTFAIGILLPIAPKMALHYKNKNRKALMRVVMICNALIAAIGALAAIAVYLFGKPVFTFMFGEGITKHINLLYLLIAVSMLIAMVNCYSTLFIATRKLCQLLAFSVFSCLAVLLLSLYSVSEYGIYGGAYSLATVIGLQFIAETLYVGMMAKKL